MTVSKTQINKASRHTVLDRDRDHRSGHLGHLYHHVVLCCCVDSHREDLDESAIILEDCGQWWLTTWLIVISIMDPIAGRAVSLQFPL